MGLGGPKRLGPLFSIFCSSYSSFIPIFPLWITAFKFNNFIVFNFPYFIGYFTYKMPVVAYKYNTAFIIIQSAYKQINGMYVKVIGRFIQH